MKILHLLNHSRQGNGNVHQAVDLACEQVRQGDSVAFCSGGGHFDALLERRGVQVFRVRHGKNALSLAPAIVQFRAVLRTFRPDIIHAHMMASAILGRLARSSGTGLVTTVHNSFQTASVLMGLGDRVIAVSQAVADDMAGRGIPRGKLRVVLNGTVGSARFEPGPVVPAALARPNVTFVGGLHHRKGIDILLDAFARVARDVPGVTLNIVGEGPEEDDYRALADRLCPGRVVFHGFVVDPRPLLAASDVFVLSSRADPAPLVISEARDAGCAVVATDVGGVAEMLSGGEAGRLVPSENPEALAAALTQILADPAALAAGRRLARIGIENFTVARVVEQTRGVYEQAAKVEVADRRQTAG